MSATTLYQLSNALLGSGLALQVNDSSDSLTLKGASSDTALNWTIAANSDLNYSAGRYNICTAYQGVPYCLDVLNDNTGSRTTPDLATPSNVMGQQWTMTSVGDGYKLSNDYTGSGWYLDTSNNSSRSVFMSQGDSPGQHWTFPVVQGQSAGSSFVPSATTTVTAPASSTTSEAEASGTAFPTNNSSSTNAGAIAGGVVGGVAFLAILLVTLWWILRRRRRQRQTNATLVEAPGEASVQEEKKKPQELDGYHRQELDASNAQELHGSHRIFEGPDGQIYEMGDDPVIPELATHTSVKKKRPVR